MGKQEAKECDSREYPVNQPLYQGNIAKECPWCQRWWLKDNACAYIFACGLDTKNRFYVGMGCGKSWCWNCGKKYCGQYYNPQTGEKLPTAKDHHDSFCCRKEEDFTEEEYCSGGCSGHCIKRWEAKK